VLLVRELLDATVASSPPHERPHLTGCAPLSTGVAARRRWRGQASRRRHLPLERIADIGSIPLQKLQPEDLDTSAGP
jgi:hypothetical protein